MDSEWTANKHIGTMLAEVGDAVILLPNKDEMRSPDALRNGEEWEFKTIRAFNLKNAVHNALRKGKTQSPTILCFIDMLYTIENITLGIFNAVKFAKEACIEKIGILFLNGNLIGVTREEVRNRLFVRKFY